MILRRRILCREQVELPPVCVFYGETTGVEPRQRTLRTVKPISIVPLILIGLSVLFAPGFVLELRGPLTVYVLVCAACLAILIGGAVLIWKKGCYITEATWYVCERYRRRALFERRIVQAIIFAGGLAVLYSAPSVDIPFGLAFILVVIAMIGSTKMNCELSLMLHGKKDDAFVLKGHRKKFFEAVRRQQQHF